MKDNNSLTIEPSRESVASCLERLGPPPEDIWQQWVVEARALVPGQATELFDPHSEVWRQLLIDSSGRLFTDADMESHDAAAVLANERSPVTNQSPESKATQTASNPQLVELPEDAYSAIELSGELSDELSDESSRDNGEGEAQPPTSQRKRLVAIAAAILLAIFGGSAVWYAVQPESEVVSSASPNRSEPATQDIFAPVMAPSSSGQRDRSLENFPSTQSVNTQGNGEDSLQTVMASPIAEEPMNARVLSTGFSLDAFLPPEMLQTADTDLVLEGSASPDDSTQPNAGTDENLPQDEAAPIGQTPNDGGATPSNGSGGEPFPMDDEDESDDSSDDPIDDSIDDALEQTTVTRPPTEAKPGAKGEATNTDVAIPRLPANNETPLPEPIDLLNSQGTLPTAWSLEFPGSGDQPWATIQAAETETRWQIVDMESSRPIASIGGSEATPNTIEFAWLDAARKLARTKTLTNCRITSDRGDLIYLRPSFVGEPIQLAASQRDVKLKWNLQSTTAPGLARLAMEVVVPKEVELKWIEPIDEASPRKTRGVAMLKLKTSDETAIVVRMDVSTNQSLSLRMRFGARLDPAMPWQWTDAKTIRSSLNAVTDQLEAADRQLLNLDVAITRAERIRARRQEYLLEDQRDRIDEAVKGWTIVAKRLADLDQLVAFLDAGAQVRPKLFIPWPDDEQVIFQVGEDDQ